jgi:hypothetical protein
LSRRWHSAASRGSNPSKRASISSTAIAVLIAREHISYFANQQPPRRSVAYDINVATFFARCYIEASARLARGQVSTFHPRQFNGGAWTVLRYGRALRWRGSAAPPQLLFSQAS